MRDYGRASNIPLLFMSVLGIGAVYLIYKRGQSDADTNVKLPDIDCKISTSEKNLQQLSTNLKSLFEGYLYESEEKQAYKLLQDVIKNSCDVKFLYGTFGNYSSGFPIFSSGDLWNHLNRMTNIDRENLKKLLFDYAKYIN